MAGLDSVPEVAFFTGLPAGPQPSEAEVGDIADEVEAPVKATERIFDRLVQSNPELAQLAQNANWYQQKAKGGRYKL